MSADPRWSRRQFIVTSGLAAALGGTTLQATPNAAQGKPGRRGRARGKETATFTRYDIASPQGQEMLEGYATAVEALLVKDPMDPLNWYRLTFIHTLDCPHGNWWFLPWHRGYIGYVEQILRQHSGMPEVFALPYWDWTAHPEVPSMFFGANNPLDPTSSLYIQSYSDFKSEFSEAVDDFYSKLSEDQQTELEARGLQTPDKLWAAIQPPAGYFFEGSAARCLTAAQPSFANPPDPACVDGCDGTPTAVSQPTITAALAPTDFITFGSGCVDQHSQSTQQGVLESQPHNLVHNCVGGFMSEFMSPVDPIFFMHHSNIERLWLVWTAKQEQNGDPTLPEGKLSFSKWSQEQFLFYVNAEGKTLETKAGDFATVGDFDYTYAAAPTTALATAAVRKIQQDAFIGVDAIPAGLVEAASKEGGPELLAHVTINPKGRQKGKAFHVNVNLPDGVDGTDAEQPHHAATLAFFGAGHGHGHGPTTFVVPISQALRDLRRAGRLEKGQPIELSVTTEDAVEKSTSKAKAVRAVVSSH